MRPREAGQLRPRVAAVAAVAAVAVAAVAVAVAASVRALPDAGATPVVEGHGTDLLAGLMALTWTATGALLAWVRPRNPLGWLFVAVGVFQSLQQGLAAYGGYALATGADWPAARWAAWVSIPLWMPGLIPLFNLLPALYPDGRLPGRFWKATAGAASAGIALLSLGALLHPDAWDDVGSGPSPLAAAQLAIASAVVGAVLLFPATLAIWGGSVVRLARARAPQRQQLLWLLVVVVPFGIVAFSDLPGRLFDVLAVLVPVAVAVGVFRYNLLGIEVILRRGLVYGALTAAVVAVYLVVTALAGARLDRGPLPGVVAAALVAVGLAPLRERLQSSVDRLVYGDRHDPLAAVARLGDRVAAAEEPDLLPAVLATVADAVRSPGVTVVAGDGSVLASHGGPTRDGEDLPLRVGGRDVGTLQVARRTPGERYSAADRRLLAALAQQVAAVVRALALAEQLEAERDRVVAATRVERDRLRRDLHDGLGPSLAGVSLGLQALDDARAAHDETAAAELSGRIRAEVGTAVAEVRRILDDLRPAVLDSVPLPEALARHAGTLSAGGTLDVRVSADGVPPLPAPVETAAYRIVTEALTNVVRHARASTAGVDLAVTGATLVIRVADDGRGLPDLPHNGGMGLESMRQRAAVLGGQVKVGSDEQGTTVTATLPLAGRPT